MALDPIPPDLPSQVVALLREAETQLLCAEYDLAEALALKQHCALLEAVRDRMDPALAARIEERLEQGLLIKNDDAAAMIALLPRVIAEG